MKRLRKTETTKKRTLIAIILDEPSQKKMFQLLQDFKTPEMHGWSVRCEHVTLNFGVPTKEQLDLVGKLITFKAWTVGFSEKAIAARVILKKKIRPEDTFAHVTLAFDPETGQGGVESKNITRWIPIPNITLKGTVQIGHGIIKNKKRTLLY